ncbi:hypothetical protein NYE40_02445 [Paenibacillus sp. FSL W8-1187]|uniref:hypothetical protein n=1 Tax=Paenibacillus sp. FSL W8-1187 TaxID=2975339 RepID=UPI0030D82D4C
MDLEREVQDLKRRVEELEERERAVGRGPSERRYAPAVAKEKGFGKSFLTGFGVVAAVLILFLFSIGVIQFITAQ